MTFCPSCAGKAGFARMESCGCFVKAESAGVEPIRTAEGRFAHNSARGYVTAGAKIALPRFWCR